MQTINTSTYTVKDWLDASKGLDISEYEFSQATQVLTEILFINMNDLAREIAVRRADELRELSKY
jgi:hypothetical protein